MAKQERDEVRLRNLELLVAEAGSAVQLARRAGTSESYLSQVRRGLPTPKGTARAVGDALAHKLEEAMGKPGGWMDERHPAVPATSRASRSRRHPLGPAYYPLLSWDRIRDRARRTRAPRSDEPAESYLCPVPCSEATFVLRVRGESMAPKFHPGELIYVDPEVAPEDGRYIVAHIGDAREPVLRRYVVEGGRTYLQALNPDWPERIRELDADVRIRGVVVFKGEVA